MKNTIIGIAIAVVIMVLLPKATIVESKKQVVITTPPAKVKLLATITSQQRVWLNKLEQCESNVDKDMKIIDSNNRYSYGILQFQMETFLREGKKYGLVDSKITMVKAEKLIFNVELQEKLADKMLTDGGESNWYNCWNHKLKVKYPYDRD